MSKRWIVAGVLAGVVLVCTSAAWQQRALEFKFVKAGPVDTNAKGEQVSFTEKAATVASDLSGEGWTLLSASAADADNGCYVVLAFSRPKE